MFAIAAALAAALLPLEPAAPATPAATGQTRNILILVLDDLGVDGLASYGVGADLPSTPNIDALAAMGMQFENVWSNPVCSPTRATIQTGRYSFRTGIGYTVVAASNELETGEVTLPEMLRISGVPYRSAAFGKWHLGNGGNGGTKSPNVAGYDHYQGALINLHPPEDYFRWMKTTNGDQSLKTGYITTDTVNDARNWINAQNEPWIAHVAFHAPHTPHHAPPQELHTVDLTDVGNPLDEPRPYWKAMVEAVDTEIGRLLTQIDVDYSETTVFLVGDNGTHKDVVLPPYDSTKAKGTAYQGGIHVPLIVVGPGVMSGTTCSALVNTTDLFATVAQLTNAKYPPLYPGLTPGWRTSFTLPGLTVPMTQVGNELDSVSLLPYFSAPNRPSIRQFVWSELFRPSDDTAPTTTRRAIRNDRFKLILRTTPTNGDEEHFFDLIEDPFEQTDLLTTGDLTTNQQKAYDQLLAEANDLLSGR